MTLAHLPLIKRHTSFDEQFASWQETTQGHSLEHIPYARQFMLEKVLAERA